MQDHLPKKVGSVFNWTQDPRNTRRINTVAEVGTNLFFEESLLTSSRPSSFKGNSQYEDASRFVTSNKKLYLQRKNANVNTFDTNKERSNIARGWQWEIPVVKALTAPIGLPSKERYKIMENILISKYKTYFKAVLACLISSTIYNILQTALQTSIDCWPLPWIIIDPVSAEPPPEEARSSIQLKAQPIKHSGNKHSFQGWY